jgi:hypothetical protein
LILPNATFCLGFLGFTNTTYCPIFNCNPPNNSNYINIGCTISKQLPF